MKGRALPLCPCKVQTSICRAMARESSTPMPRYGALYLGVTEQKLNGAQITGYGDFGSKADIGYSITRLPAISDAETVKFNAVEFLD